MDALLKQLLDKQAITEQLYHYCRGVDRMDSALTRACWHVDGTADYVGMFQGTADALLDWMWEVHTGMQAHSHQMTNILIELNGDQAASETYVTVVLRTRGDAALDIFVRGRYLDRWSRRDGVWAIDHRIHVPDHATTLPVPEHTPAEAAGARARSDPSYQLFG
ncbi:MAG: nuclear transport factor 2 family protein [Deltaproteobacteria bacterium]|nr:nuclear transport factor 2 family protein [Deltaproteobacteria bacterium]